MRKHRNREGHTGSRDRGTSRTRRTRSKFLRIPIHFNFNLTVTSEELNNLMIRMLNDGIGDWGLIDNKHFEVTTHNKIKFPIYITDITSNKVYPLTKQKLMRSIRDTLIDFPYALSTIAGYNLAIGSLTGEDIDEIIQVALFKDIKYSYI